MHKSNIRKLLVSVAALSMVTGYISPAFAEDSDVGTVGAEEPVETETPAITEPTPSVEPEPSSSPTPSPSPSAESVEEKNAVSATNTTGAEPLAASAEEEFLADLADDGTAELGDYRVEEMQDGIYHMDESTTALPGGAADSEGNMNNPASIYFVQKNNELLIVDAGNMPAKDSQKESDARTIVNALAGDGNVTIALTHNHGDHTGLIDNGNVLADINDQVSAVYIGEADYDASSAEATTYDGKITKLNDGDTFTFASTEFEAVAIPAHTPGSLVFVDRTDNVIFTGDSIGSGFIWCFWNADSNPLGALETGVKELQGIVQEMGSPRILAGHRWQQFWEENAQRPGEIGIQYLNDMNALLTGLQNGSTVKSDYASSPVEGGIELSANGGKAKIDTTQEIINAYLDGVNSYTGEADAWVFSAADQLSIETDNNTNAAKFLVYVDKYTTKEEAQKMMDDMGITDIINKSASMAIVVNAKDTATGVYTEDDVTVYNDILKNKVGPTTNLNLVGIGNGATFINQYLAQYDWGVSGIMTYGGEAGNAPKYSVPVYVSNSDADVAEAYKDVNKATSVTTDGTMTTSVNPDSRFEIVVENSADEDVNTAFKNAWETVLSKFGRIGNITREPGVGTWYTKDNTVEREFMFFDSTDAIKNVERTVFTEDLDGDGINSLWYVYMPEQSKNAAEESVPVVFLMHGNTNDPRTQWETSGWANIASEEGVIMVCPEWQGHTYQGYTYDPMTDDTNYTPDSAFITCVKDVLATYPQIDESRVYISGLSAGCRNTTNNSLVNTKYFAAGAGQSGPFNNSAEQLALLQQAVDANKEQYDMPIIYFAGDKDEYLANDWDTLSMNGGLQNVQLFQEMNDMEVTQVEDLSEEFIDLYGIPFDTVEKIENEGLCDILRGTMKNDKGVEIVVNRIYDWGHWNYPADARMMWDFMKKYSRNPETGELTIDGEPETPETDPSDLKPGVHVSNTENEKGTFDVSFVYEDKDERDAVKVTVSGNMQWYDPEDPSVVNFVDTSGAGAVIYDAYNYREGLFNTGYGLSNDSAVYTLNETAEDERFELTLPLPGNEYYYDYTVTYSDGTTETIQDPANESQDNPFNGHDSGHSLFFVGDAEHTEPGQEYIYPQKDGKIGSRRYVTYTAVDGTEQPLEVYLPYGYDEDKEYKTIYVSHGGGGNEAEWMEIGALGNIMDNLIADGEVAPSVVVTMDNTYFGWDYDKIAENFEKNIIPYIEENYSVSTKAEDRALAGLSAGSGMSLTMMLEHTDLFGAYGNFSGANIEAVVEDAETLKTKTVYLSVGCVDFARPHFPKLIEMLDDAGITYNNDGELDLKNGAHDWGTWRASITTFVKDYLWDVEKTDETVKPSDKPGTGVYTSPYIWAGVIGAAGIAAAVFMNKKRRATQKH